MDRLRLRSEPERSEDLRVIHLDMDAFYASVEQRDDPSLRGRPVIVGGTPASRGVVATCSYEARKFGVRSAMPAEEARRLCPSAIFLPTDFARYKQVSRQVKDLLRSHTQDVEMLGLDEAFLFVANPQQTVAVAREVKRDITGEIGITCSVGVSYARPLAKLASEWQKPDGFTVIDRHLARRLLPKVPLEQLWGIGPQTARTLKRQGIETGGDFFSTSTRQLIKMLGPGRAWDIALLCAGRPLSPRVRRDRRAKSVSRETTLPNDVADPGELESILRELVDDVTARVEELNLTAMTVGIKVRYSNFRTLTRARTDPTPYHKAEAIHQTARELLGELIDGRQTVRLLGVTLSNLDYPDMPRQLGFELVK